MINGYRKITEKQLYNKIEEIVESPEGKAEIEMRIREESEEKTKFKEGQNKFIRKQSRIYYLYHELIFKIFDGNREVPKHEILTLIEKELKTSNNESTKIFEDCKSYLLSKCRWNDNFRIADFCFDNVTKEEEEILSYNEWLTTNNKELKKKSVDQIEYEHLSATNYTLWIQRYKM